MAERPLDACFTSIRKIGRIAFLIYSQCRTLGQKFVYNTTAKCFNIQERYRKHVYQSANQFYARKLQSGVFEPPFGGLWGNVRALFMTV